MAEVDEIDRLKRQIKTLRETVGILTARPEKRAYYSAEERRQIIIDAARRVLRDEERRFSLDEVARHCAAETSVSLIKHYFRGGQAALLRAVNSPRRRARRKIAA